MASSKGMAPGVLLPTVPGMGAARPTTGTKGTSTRTKVVRVPKAKVSGRGLVKGPKISVKRPKMPKDAMALHVPKAKRVKNGKEFSTKLKPVI